MATRMNKEYLEKMSKRCRFEEFKLKFEYFGDNSVRILTNDDKPVTGFMSYIDVSFWLDGFQEALKLKSSL